MKKDNVTEILLPRYSELSAQEIWTLIKDVDEIMTYFHDYTDKKAPERDYIFSVLATVKYEQIKGIVKNAFKKRAKENELPEDEYI